MTETLSIRELSRSGEELQQFDYVDIEDRKSRRYKGVFVPAPHAQAVKEFLEEKLRLERKAKSQALSRFAGLATGEIGEAAVQDLKARKGRQP